ncbi:MAG: anthranilate phosphoribosyltransferase [Ignavibacteriales bacterium]|nr:anthranilate phosphoribosyltransferase [Ignavibacteriales bacterium]
MIKNYIEKILEQENLTISEAYDAMDNIMSGKVNNSQLAAFLIALKVKGETAEEIAGLAKAMRYKSIKLDVDNENLIDVCGTGGDSSGTFNISTAASFVVAAAGVKVAKHGNRSISSNSGSADVLTELGVNINLNAEQSCVALKEIGISFLFAPNFHPAMKYAAAVRKELGMKTVFNLLGPLTNPANTKKQLIGVYNNKSSKLMSEAAGHLDMEKVCFICTGNNLDEISLIEDTDVNEFNKNTELNNYKLSHDSFNYPQLNIDDIKGASPKYNAELILNLFKSKKKNAAFFVTSANAAVALYCGNFSKDLKVCKDAAEEAILSGGALSKLHELKSISERFS